MCFGPHLRPRPRRAAKANGKPGKSKSKAESRRKRGSIRTKQAFILHFGEYIECGKHVPLSSRHGINCFALGCGSSGIGLPGESGSEKSRSHTVPHLRQEYVALKRGLQTHNFLNGGLEDIICEHVKITGFMAQALQKLPLELRHQLQQLKVSERVFVLMSMDRNSNTSKPAAAATAGATTSTPSHAHRKRRRIRTQSPVGASASPATLHLLQPEPR
uniref:Uncharacterized protein n=1 Tax=Drosophila pseudoobscura pseudoobscura TaxID=46245 RepID=A0A0R3NWU1_DROPS